VPQSEGIPRALVDLVTIVPFNDLKALEAAFSRHPGDVAALIVEPAMMNVGIALPDGRTVPALVDSYPIYDPEKRRPRA